MHFCHCSSSPFSGSYKTSKCNILDRKASFSSTWKICTPSRYRLLAFICLLSAANDLQMILMQMIIISLYLPSMHALLNKLCLTKTAFLANTCIRFEDKHECKLITKPDLYQKDNNIKWVKPMLKIVVIQFYISVVAAM